MLYSVDKQAYKLKLLKKWKVYNIYYILLLKQNITKKDRVEKVPGFDANNNSKKYNLEAIWDSAIYANKSKPGYLLGFYYLVV